MKIKRALKRAIDAAGGQSALAKRIGISRQAVQQWDEIPLERVFDVEKATGIHRSELRPDYFARERTKIAPTDLAKANGQA